MLVRPKQAPRKTTQAPMRLLKNRIQRRLSEGKILVENAITQFDMRGIYITEVDLERLRELVGVARSCSELDPQSLKVLENELDRAEIVPAETIPPDVITMNSRARLRDLGTQEEIIFTIVYPRAANLEKGKISVMSPLGMALLGYRAGDILDWGVPDGVRRLEVVEVAYQPEAAGDFHL